MSIKKAKMINCLLFDDKEKNKTEIITKSNFNNSFFYYLNVCVLIFYIFFNSATGYLFSVNFISFSSIIYLSLSITNIAFIIGFYIFIKNKYEHIN